MSLDTLKNVMQDSNLVDVSGGLSSDALAACAECTSSCQLGCSGGCNNGSLSSH
jgi:hypothetical protein